ncbi:hypothetical protein C9J85_10845 [Haloferax sp. wsp5]|nr:hypothetical protein C9J85_10845 [Haloferax sp. wsp5]
MCDRTRKTSDESDESLVDVSELADDPDAVVGRFAEEFLRETAHGSVSSVRRWGLLACRHDKQIMSPGIIIVHLRDNTAQ